MDWHSIGHGLAVDWQSIDAVPGLSIDIGLAMNWHQIGIRLAQNWRWIGTRLAPDWRRNGDGSVELADIGWHSIGIRLATD